jgi:hypothetical protein
MSVQQPRRWSAEEKAAPAPAKITARRKVKRAGWEDT